MHRTVTRIRTTLIFTVIAAIGLSAPSLLSADPAPQAAGLKIVVIEGEDAINIIQQKTAVAPVVEVRDRNDQPVAGAVVRFAIQGGRASFNGARALSVTTNAAGRAAVSGLTPSGSGVFQITASAAFNGQTAAVTIAQTNVMTAAQAAGVASASGGSTGGASAGGAAGGAGGGGGGLSATTIGIVGGAVAGGTLATKEVLGGGGVAIYEGDFRIDVVESLRQVRGNGTIALTCTNTVSLTGEVRGEIDEQADGTLTGTVSANGFYKQLASTCPPAAPGTNEKISFGSGVVTGTAAAFQASGQSQSADGTGGGAMAFSGTLTEGTIAGTFTIGPSFYKSIADATGFFSDSVTPAQSTQVRLTK